MASSWLDFFNGEHALYVNARHKRLHDQLVAREIVSLVSGPEAAVLDFGCGDATEAATVADRCGTLYLSDAAPAVLARVAERFAGRPDIETLGPKGVEKLDDGTLDLVVVVSILQYLSREDLARWLQVWRAKLKPGGRLVLGDVIPPDIGPVTDALALLRFGVEGGFAVAAFGGLLRTFFSDYRALRSNLGFMTYREEEILGILSAAGFAARRRQPNIGHNQARMTFIGDKAA